MKRILLCQIDGSFPNVALMRISAHHKALGDEVDIRHGAAFERGLFDVEPDLVYASCIFTKSLGTAMRLRKLWPDAIIGGTGFDATRTLEHFHITTTSLDYSLYPRFRQSIGFTQRGCRLRCAFCVVPQKEGAMKSESTIHDIWRGEKWPKELLLLDNDFFGQEHWKARIEEIRSGGFKVSFNQGINARFLTDETAEAIASIDYRDNEMSAKRIYTAWDNLKDEERLFAGLRRMVKYGVKPDHIMVYVLVGYWTGETMQDCLYRIQKLLDFGARPYPMPYRRTPELVGLQRWAVGAYAKRVPWDAWEEAHFRPERLTKPTAPLFEMLV